MYAMTSVSAFHLLLGVTCDPHIPCDQLCVMDKVQEQFTRPFLPDPPAGNIITSLFSSLMSITGDS
jgi:hypothetical protein